MGPEFDSYEVTLLYFLTRLLMGPTSHLEKLRIQNFLGTTGNLGSGGWESGMGAHDRQAIPAQA